MLNDVTVFNIRESLSATEDKELGEDRLRDILSDFLCDKNLDVEKFLSAYDQVEHISLPASKHLGTKMHIGIFVE